jgi:hypothetical protein
LCTATLIEGTFQLSDSIKIGGGMYSEARTRKSFSWCCAQTSDVCRHGYTSYFSVPIVIRPVHTWLVVRMLNDLNISVQEAVTIRTNTVCEWKTLLATTMDCTTAVLKLNHWDIISKQSLTSSWTVSYESLLFSLSVKMLMSELVFAAYTVIKINIIIFYWYHKQVQPDVGPERKIVLKDHIGSIYRLHEITVYLLTSFDSWNRES